MCGGCGGGECVSERERVSCPMVVVWPSERLIVGLIKSRACQMFRLAGAHIHSHEANQLVQCVLALVWCIKRGATTCTLVWAGEKGDTNLAGAHLAPAAGPTAQN